MNLLKQLEAEQMKALRTTAHPAFRPGDTLQGQRQGRRADL